MKKITEIYINLSDGYKHDEIADALRGIAESIEEGYTSGIVGWSSINWYIE